MPVRLLSLQRENTAKRRAVRRNRRPTESQRGGVDILHRSAAVPTSVSAASAPLSTSDQCVSIDPVCAPGVSSGKPAARSGGTAEQDFLHLQQEPA